MPSQTYKVSEMANAILDIPTHVVARLQEKTVTENGIIIPDTGYDALSQVTVNVAGSGTIEPLSITENGTYNPPSGVDRYAPITVTVPTTAETYAFIEADFPVGEACTATKGTTVLSATDTTLGNFIFAIPEAGTWTIESNGYSVNTNISKYGQRVNVAVGEMPIVSWATGTDAEIAAMIRAMDRGDMTIAQTGWQIGDTRNCVTSNYGTIRLTIMDSQKYDLVDGGKDHFVVGLPQVAGGTIKFNNSGTTWWGGSTIRTTINDTFRNSLPEVIRNCFKQFNVLSAASPSATSVSTTQDYFALFAEKEIYGARTYSNTYEADALTQIEYYKDENHRKKNGKWWGRSIMISGTTLYNQYIKTDGAISYTDGQGYMANLSPFGCI